MYADITMCISIDYRIADHAQGGSGVQGCKRSKRTGNACSVLYVYSSRTLGTGVDGGEKLAWRSG